ncbi:ABC transporter family protein [Mycobacterium kansasii]|uniref:ABC transporter family protein n=1 Tax=Mycobacterium kansasii TaxID=1768 RepID=A0A1V3XB19_MYCKA|nr:ABC transporter family protein [Mycobacterium kansasii]
MSAGAPPLLSVEGLEVRFGADEPVLRGIDLTVLRGQTVAVVGESGSGKSTVAAAILGLLAPGGRIIAGRIVFDGRDLTSSDRRLMRSIRGREIGYVPQDPMTNLNPVWRVGFQVREALRANTSGRDVRRRAVELLGEAGMPDPGRQAHRYPHQLSGGMCQRALIAIGLAGRPRLLIADEPTSALDVTVQRQVLDHLQHLTDELGTALLLITHDLALAAERAESVVVVNRGVVAESGAAQELLRDPQHEYTRRLVAAAPSLTARRPAPNRPQLRPPGQDDDIVVVSELTKTYPQVRGVPWRRAEFRAVDSVSFRLRREARWQSSANPDPANPPWRAWCSVCCSRRRAPWFSTARTSTGWTGPARSHFAGGCSRCSRTPTAAWIPGIRCFAASRNRCASIGSGTAAAAGRRCASWSTRWHCRRRYWTGCHVSCRVVSANGSRSPGR